MMLGWLYRVVVGNFKSCKHEWEIINKGTVSSQGRKVGVFYVLQCKHCGELKQEQF